MGQSEKGFGLFWLRTYNVYFDGDFAEGEPGDEDAVGDMLVSWVCGVKKGLGETNKMVIKTANQSSWALNSEFASLRHSPVLMSYVFPRTTKTHVVFANVSYCCQVRF